MSWKGRILGAIIGLFISSVLGAIIGFTLGYFLYDKPKNDLLEQKKASDRAFFHNKRTVEHEALIIATFRLMGYVARGAGTINADHIRQAEQKMEQMNLDSAMRQKAKESFNLGKSDDFNLSDEAFRLRALIGSNKIILSSLLEILVMLALADEVLSAGEYERLMNIAQVLDVPSDQMDRLIKTRLAEIQLARFYRQFAEARNRTNKQEQHSSYERYEQEQHSSYERQKQEQQHSYEQHERQEEQRRSYQSQSHKSELEAAYELLGVNANTPWEDIRRAHKKLMLKYHPDRLAAQGLPPELVSVYTKKAQDIQAAFNLIKSKHGK